MVQRWLAWLVGCAVILIVAASTTSNLLFPAAPASEPVVTVTPAAQPPGVEPAEARSLPALGDVASAVTLALGEEWRLVALDEAQLGQALTTIRRSDENALGNAALTLQTALSADASVLTATHHREPASTLTVMAVKRNGLSLERYLAEVRDRLSRDGAAIHEAAVDGGWREDGLPAAMLHYTLPAIAGNGSTAALDGLQVVTLDASAAYLVVFTFTTPSVRYTALEPHFAALLNAAQF